MKKLILFTRILGTMLCYRHLMKMARWMEWKLLKSLAPLSIMERDTFEEYEKKHPSVFNKFLTF